MTLATSGRIWIDSLESAALQQSLENRLMERLDTAGSTLFNLTWKRKSTPLGRRYLERQAVALRTGDRGFTSLPTPQSHDERKRGNTEADHHYSPHDLSNVVDLSAVPTPNAMEEGQTSRGGKRYDEKLMGGIAKLASCPTPMAGTPAQNGYNEAGNTDYSRKVVELATVGTPRNNNAHGYGNGDREMVPGGSRLEDQVQLSIPISPHVQKSKDAGMLATDGMSAPRKRDSSVSLATVATPRSEDSECAGAHRGIADGLHSQAKLAAISTPSSRDWKDSPGMSESGVDPDGSTRTRLDQLPRQAQLAVSGETVTGGTGATESTGQLNPEYSRWLQGFPAAWGSCADTAMRLQSRSRKRSSAPILT